MGRTFFDRSLLKRPTWTLASVPLLRWTIRAEMCEDSGDAQETELENPSLCVMLAFFVAPLWAQFP
jgi:hypothetical protein